MINRWALAGMAAAACMSLPSAWAQNAAAYRPPIATFDGTNGVTLPSDPALELQRFGTIEFWVQPKWTNAPDFDPVILSYFGPWGLRYAIAMAADRKAIGFVSDRKWEVARFDFTDPKFHHVAFVVMDGATVVRVDGTTIDTLPIGFSAASHGNLRIGSLDGTQSPFTGSLAGLRIWDAALEPAVLDAYKLVDILSEAGRQHPDFEALVGVSKFDGGARDFILNAPPPEESSASGATQ